jgi:hypothetical protein
VRVTAQLVEGKGGGHVWADRYDRDLTDIFAIQDEIAHSIVDQLKVKLLPKSAKPSTVHRPRTSRPIPTTSEAGSSYTTLKTLLYSGEAHVWHGA